MYTIKEWKTWIEDQATALFGSISTPEGDSRFSYNDGLNTVGQLQFVGDWLGTDVVNCKSVKLRKDSFIELLNLEVIRLSFMANHTMINHPDSQIERAILESKKEAFKTTSNWIEENFKGM